MLRDLCCRICLLLALLGAGGLLPVAVQAQGDQAGAQPAVSIGTPARSAQARAQAQAHDRAGHGAHARHCCHACTGALNFVFVPAPLPPPAGPLPPYRLARHDSPIPEPPHRPPRRTA